MRARNSASSSEASVSRYRALVRASTRGRRVRFRPIRKRCVPGGAGDQGDARASGISPRSLRVKSAKGGPFRSSTSQGKGGARRPCRPMPPLPRPGPSAVARRRHHGREARDTRRRPAARPPDDARRARRLVRLVRSLRRRRSGPRLRGRGVRRALLRDRPGEASRAAAHSSSLDRHPWRRAARQGLRHHGRPASSGKAHGSAGTGPDLEGWILGR